MKIKKIGAILAGAVMIGSAVAAAWDPSDDTDFFINSETGEPNSIIVVGANAAASDVTAAGWIAAQIGSMAHYEEVIPQYDISWWPPSGKGHEHIDDNYDDTDPNLGDNNATANCDALAVGDTLGSFNTLPYVELDSLWYEDWNKDWYIDPTNPLFNRSARSGDAGYGYLNNWESREEVFVNFTQDPMTGIYPMIDLYDFQYRTVIERDPTYNIWYGGQYNITPYALVDQAVHVKWLCDFYDIIGWGYDPVTNDDYVVYGTPHYSEDECRGDDEMVFDVGETKMFYGWEITLDDINIYENKVQWLIKGPTDEVPCEYIVAISGFEPDVPPYYWGEDRYRHCLASVQLKACEYDVIGITDPVCDIDWMIHYRTYDGEFLVAEDDAEIAVFALDTIKTFVGATGHNKAVARLYALEDYGVLHDAICIKPCGESDNQWDLDIVWHQPADTNSSKWSWGTEAEYVDHEDGAPGDPAYGAGVGFIDWDDTNVGGGLSHVDQGDDGWFDSDGDGDLDHVYPTMEYWDIVPWSNSYYGDPPVSTKVETGLDYYYDIYNGPLAEDPDGDPDGVELAIAMKLHTLIDIRICGSSQTIQLCCFDVPMCGPDDFWVNTGDASVYLSLSVDDSDDPNHTDMKISNGFVLEQKSEKDPQIVTHFVEIDPMSIVVNDDEVTQTMKIGYNLILVGGPGLVVCVGAEPQVANTLTKELIDQGLSTLDWATSLGEYEYIPNAFAEGKDVIIVAGADREATRYAVKTLINDLTT